MANRDCCITSPPPLPTCTLSVRPPDFPSFPVIYPDVRRTRQYVFVYSMLDISLCISTGRTNTPCLESQHPRCPPLASWEAIEAICLLFFLCGGQVATKQPSWAVHHSPLVGYFLHSSSHCLPCSISRKLARCTRTRQADNARTPVPTTVTKNAQPLVFMPASPSLHWRRVTGLPPVLSSSRCTVYQTVQRTNLPKARSWYGSVEILSSSSFPQVLALLLALFPHEKDQSFSYSTSILQSRHPP